MDERHERQRINIDIRKTLWREMSIMVARLGIEKRAFVEAALQEKIEREQKRLDDEREMKLNEEKEGKIEQKKPQEPQQKKTQK